MADRIHATSRGATNLAVALVEAVAAERRFRDAIASRFGGQPIRLVRISFGQDALDDPEAIRGAVEFEDADHATVRLPSRSRPDKPHVTQMVRVKGVWKFSERDLPGLDDGADQTAAVMRKLAGTIDLTARKVSAGEYRNAGEAMRALMRGSGAQNQ